MVRRIHIHNGFYYGYGIVLITFYYKFQFNDNRVLIWFSINKTRLEAIEYLIKILKDSEW